MRISDVSSDVCSSELAPGGRASVSSPVVKGNGDRIEPLALPLSQRTEASAPRLFVNAPDSGDLSANSITAECFLEQADDQRLNDTYQIGRASCRERVCPYV